VLPYAISIGAVLAAVLAVVGLTVLRKPARQVGDLSAGAAPLEVQQPLAGIMGGELPDAYSVMILGDAGSGKSILCQQLTHGYLNEGKPCIYVTYDCFPDEIRDNMKDLGWDLSMREQDGTFAFVDCYSSTTGKSSRERHSVKQPFALHELGTAISSALGEMEQRSPRIFLDSTVPLFTRLEPANVVEFLQDRSATVKGEDGVFLFTVGGGTIPQDLQRRLEELVDCVIDLQVVEQKGETARRLRIRKLRGRSFSEQWVSFRIDMKQGFVLSGSKR
jgi:KaiC/GvpD/RAD55 family RecA-like ATPase